MKFRKMGYKLAREPGAVKYIKYLDETGREAKILIDKIAFAGFGNAKDEKKQHKIAKCNLI